MKRIRTPFAHRIRACAAALGLTACFTPLCARAPQTLQFPPEHSLGRLYTLDAGIERKIQDFHYHVDGTDMRWEYLGEATGEVKIPAGKRVRLILNRLSGDELSALAQLEAQALYELSLGETAGEAALSHLAPLTGLKVLHFPRAYPPEARLPRFSAQALKQLGALQSLERLGAPEQLGDAELAALAEALPQLKGLYLVDNQLTDAGLAVLAKLTRLEELSIGGKKLTSDGLAALAKLPSLQHLWPWGVKDSALQQLRKISSLKTLTLPEAITDIGVGYLAGHPSLETLGLHNTKVTDRGVAQLKSLPSLKRLDLYKRDYDRKHPPITDAATAELKTIKSLEQLLLPAEGLTDAGLANLAELPNLRRLELLMPHYIDRKLYLHPYTEEGLKAVCGLSSLESLSLAGPGVTDDALSQVARLTHLRSLMLFGCPISNQGLAKLSALQSLERLTLMQTPELTISGLNALNGLSRLSHLQAGPLKQDEVPLDLARLGQLEYLLLSTGKGASFRDEDFACLANLKRLKWLQVGTAPDMTDAGMAHLARLSALDRISIGGPAVTDRGLAVLANLPRLDSVHLSGNFTDAGLQKLEGLKGLSHLTLRSTNHFSAAAKQRLRDRLPNLFQLAVDEDRVLADAPAAAHPKVGALAPDFSVTTLEGAPFTLSAQRGKVVLLHFWGTWCTPCVKGLPALKAAHEKLKRKYGDQLVLLDLAMDDSESKLRAVLAQHQVTTPQARIGMNSKLAAAYGVTGAPDDFLIGPDGRMLLNRESPEGPGDTERVMDKALGLAKPAPAARTALPVVIRRPASRNQ